METALELQEVLKRKDWVIDKRALIVRDVVRWLLVLFCLHSSSGWRRALRLCSQSAHRESNKAGRTKPSFSANVTVILQGAMSNGRKGGSCWSRVEGQATWTLFQSNLCMETGAYIIEFGWHPALHISSLILCRISQTTIWKRYEACACMF